MRSNILMLPLLTLVACDAGMERWADESVPEAKQAAAQRAEDLGLERRDFEIFDWDVSEGLAVGVDRVAVGVTSHSCSGVAIVYLDDLLDGYQDARQTLDTCELGGSSYDFDEEIALGDGVLVAAERIFRDTGAGYVEESVAASLPRDFLNHNLVVDADTVLLGYRSGLLVLTHPVTQAPNLTISACAGGGWGLGNGYRARTNVFNSSTSWSCSRSCCASISLYCFLTYSKYD